jgi:hypothetical protein
MGVLPQDATCFHCTLPPNPYTHTGQGSNTLTMIDSPKLIWT